MNMPIVILGDSWWRVIFKVLAFLLLSICQNLLMLLRSHAVCHSNIIRNDSLIIDSFNLSLHQTGWPVGSVSHVTKHSWLYSLLIHTNRCAISILNLKSYSWSIRPYIVSSINNIFVLIKLVHFLMDRRRSIVRNYSRLRSWVTRGISLILQLICVDLLPRAGTIQLMLPLG